MKRYIIALLAIVCLGIGIGIKASNTDVWNLAGQGIYNAQDMATVDNQYNFRLYNGSIFLGDNLLVPSTTNTQVSPSITSGGYYGVKVAIKYTGAVTNGDVICSSNVATGNATRCSSNGSTTVIGVADNTYAAGAVGYMTVGGYSIIHTTSSVAIGDILISTATTGFASTNNSATNGTVIGKALSVGAAAGDSVLAIISLQ